MGNRDGSAKKYRNKGRLDWYLVQWSIPATFQSTLSHPDYTHTSGIERCIACMGAPRGTRTVVYKHL